MQELFSHLCYHRFQSWKQIASTSSFGSKSCIDYTGHLSYTQTVIQSPIFFIVLYCPVSRMILLDCCARRFQIIHMYNAPSPSPSLSSPLQSFSINIRIHPSVHLRRSCLGMSRSIRDVLVLALLAVLHISHVSTHSPSLYPSNQPSGQKGQLTFHFANLSSISPLRSAANLMSSFRLRRTTRAATERYLL